MKLIKSCVSETLVEFNNESFQKDKFAVDIVVYIGELFQKEERMVEFINIVSTGLVGDHLLVSNTVLALKTVFAKFYGEFQLTFSVCSHSNSLISR